MYDIGIMGSIKAQRVAIKVSENLRNGKPTNYGAIMREAGYSKQTSLRPKLVTETQAYKTALATENKPLIEGLQEEITRIKGALASKNLKHEEYRTLVGSLDILVSNYQLLSGGATSREVFVLPSEVMEKNIIEQKAPDVNRLNGSTEPPNEQ